MTVLPFYAARRSAKWDQTTVLWPLFIYTDDREQGFEQWDVAWPVLQGGPRGESPGAVSLPAVHAGPQGPARRVPVSGDHVRRLRRPVSAVHPADGGIHREPQGARPGSCFTSTRTRERRGGTARPAGSTPGRSPATSGIERGRAVPEPGAAGGASCRRNEWIERNYSPLWSLYTYRANPAGESVHSFLWNFLRHEETQTGRSIEVLGPLFAYRETSEGARTIVPGRSRPL